MTDESGTTPSSSEEPPFEGGKLDRGGSPIEHREGNESESPDIREPPFRLFECISRGPYKNITTESPPGISRLRHELPSPSELVEILRALPVICEEDLSDLRLSECRRMLREEPPSLQPSDEGSRSSRRRSLSSEHREDLLDIESSVEEIRRTEADSLILRRVTSPAREDPEDHSDSTSRRRDIPGSRPSEAVTFLAMISTTTASSGSPTSAKASIAALSRLSRSGLLR